jgi:hypothetical protein
MLEPIMYASIGFLAAGLLMVAFVPLIHERAVRLTTRRLQAAVPPSFAEMQIEKDLLRAEFAMSLRRLEVSLAETRKKDVERQCEIATKTAEIQQLKAELGKTAGQLQGLQSRDQTHRSATRRVVKLLRYLSVRSRRSNAPEQPVPAPTFNEGDDWSTLLARFRAALQKGPLAHGGDPQDSSRAA